MEIDLLRGGTPTWTLTREPRTSYAVFIDRASSPEELDEGGLPFRRQSVVDLPLREPMGAVPVPLRPGEPDVALDLQGALDATYDAARYDLEIDYAQPPEPPLAGDDAERARGLPAGRTA